MATATELYIKENFDIKGLIEVGFFQTKDPSQPTFIKSRKDYPAIEARIKKFFGLKRITDYSKMPPYGCGAQTEQEKQVTDIVTPRDFLLEGNRLVSLIENN